LIGVAWASISPLGSPPGRSKCTRPSAPAARISPSGATATALSGVGKVMMFGASAGAAADQIRTLAS